VWTQAITYPTKLSHESEAKSLIANVNDKGPRSWLKTMTE
jgi:hypothetical protein